MVNPTDEFPLCQAPEKTLAFEYQGPPLAGRGGGPAGDERSESLPSLYSNNSIGTTHQKYHKEQILALCGILAPYQKRQAHCLYLNVDRLINHAPSIGHIGFFTLTTKDNVKDKAEFSRRWNSMKTNYWSKSPHFGSWIATYEQQARGAWHLHILTEVYMDIKEGFDFDAVAKGKYDSASPYLRGLWKELRRVCGRYGFGRHELLPVRSNPEAMARYIGKYISKHIGQRDEAAKGKRLISASQDWIRNSSNFQWHTEGAQEWRRKVGLFAAAVGCQSMEQLYLRLGPNWAYKHLDAIYTVDEWIKPLAPFEYKGEMIDPWTQKPTI